MIKDHAVDERKETDIPVTADLDTAAHDDVKKASDGSSIIAAEDQETGSVKWKTVKTYVKFAGLFNAAKSVCGFWISWWTSDRFTESLDWYLAVYVGLGVAQGLCLVLFNWIIISGTYKVSVTMHRNALEGILRAPMSFFDSQPIGRILNRFSNDIDAIDQNLWLSVFIYFCAAFGLACNLITISIVSYYMLGLYYLLMSFYRSSNRELKRLSSTLRSPLFAHTSESLAGVPTIRTYGAQQRFVERQQQLMDHSNSPEYIQLSSLVWVQLRAETLAHISVLVLCLIATGGRISPSLAGVAFTNSIALSGKLNLLLTATTQLEAA
ncbi:ABC transporter type 1, transmembrane domain-containing protein, partial [Blyttiomyces helicus]